MKKAIKVLVLLVAMLPVILLADGAGPGIIPDLKVKVGNKDGWLIFFGDGYADSDEEYELYEEINKKYLISKDKLIELAKKMNCYDEEKINYYEKNSGEYYYIPYNEVVDISSVRQLGLLVNTRSVDAICYKDDNEFFMDMIPISDIYDVSESVKYNNNQTLIVTNENGAQMYTGPFYSYNKVDIIPFQTEVTSTNYIYDWEYVTYNGKSGWIYYDDIAYKQEGKAVVSSEITLYNVNDKNDTKILSKNTIVDNYYLSNRNGFEGYLLYIKDNYYGKSYYYATENINETTGKIETFELTQPMSIYSDDSFSFFESCETSCYEEYKKQNKDNYYTICNKTCDEKYKKTKIGVVPKGTLLKCEYTTRVYNSTNICYIDYNGIKGWTNADETYEIENNTSITKNDTEVEYELKEIKFTTEKAKLGDKVKLNINLLNTLTNEENIKINYGRIIFNEYANDLKPSFEIKKDKNDEYYIDLTGYDYINPEEYTIDKLYVETDNGNYTFDVNEKNTNKLEIYEETKEKIPSESKKELSVYEIVLLCGVGVLILVLTSLVTILLINRKKRNKNEKVKEN